MDDKLLPGARQGRADDPAVGSRNLSGDACSGAPATAPAASLAALFRSAREAQKLSQQQVSAMTGGKVSRTTISDVERGQSLPSLDVFVSLARVLHVDPVEALERLDLDAGVPVDVTGRSLADLERRAGEHFWATNYRSALAFYDAMLDRLLLDPPDDEQEHRRVHARIEVSRAVTLRQCSALRAAEAAIKRAAQLSDGLPEIQAETYMVLASLHSHEGIFVLARLEVEKAVELSAAGPPKLQGQTWSQKGNVLFRMGDHEGARQAFLQARKYSLEAEDHHNVTSVEANLGACLLKLGSPEQARTRFMTAVELARKHGDPLIEASSLIDLGHIALETGKLDDAERFASAGLRLAQSADRVLAVFRAEWLRHLIVRQRTPNEPDTRRLERLRRLYGKVKDHASLEPIQAFRKLVLDAERGEDSDA